MLKKYIKLMQEDKELFDTVSVKDKVEIKHYSILFVIDMQNDFVPCAKNGGRFGVAEGENCAGNVVQAMDVFAKKNAYIIASRDYHPKNHVSFSTYGGPFPEHCVQGSEGSKFYKPVKDKLEDIKKNLLKKVDVEKHVNDQDLYERYLKETHQTEANPENFKNYIRHKEEKRALYKLTIVFKAFSHIIDSFGAVPYTQEYAEERRLRNTEPAGGCLDWTGGYVLKCSNIVEDIDAPPDVLSSMKKIKIHTMPMFKNRNVPIFICGLAYDYCVMDTAVNLADQGYTNVNVIYDASRAAHIKGVGQYGDGYLNDPIKILQTFREKGIKIVTTDQIV